MKNKLFVSTLREIKQSLGRFMAILLIVALGVGFFGGLKVTKPAMIKTLDEYLSSHRFFDYRLLSTIGFEEADIDKLNERLKDASGDAVSIEGSYSVDALCLIAGEAELPYRLHAITDTVNQLYLSEGRMPESNKECVIDNYMASIKIGDTVVISDNNESDTLDMTKEHELTVTGIVRSPLYINFERGTTSIGTGSLSGFIYVPKDEFDSEYYTESYVLMHAGSADGVTGRFGVYTDEYDNYSESHSKLIEDTLSEVINERFDGLLSDAEEEIADAQKKLDDASAELEDGKKELSDAKKELSDAEAELDEKSTSSKKELDDAYNKLKGAERDLDNAALMYGEEMVAPQRQELKKEWAKYYDGLNTYETEIADANQKIEDAKAEIADAEKAIKDGEEEIAEHQKEVDDAKKELDDLEEPDTYVLDRTTNIGYSCYDSDTNIVASVANVFPIFFLLVAVLICMTTMNRMVEEQRTQIGVLKALGYSSPKIMGKFVFYAGSAALIGSVGGYLLGSRFLPQAIWQGYNIMYNMGPTISYKSVTYIAVSSICAALLCSVGAAYFSVIHELHDVPANLIRPKAPKAGKRVFLEYITPLWNHMKFLHKVSARNVLRYKKRFLMMVIGIGGCTALVLTGFGIGDSIKGIANLQFDTIQVYDMAVSFSDTLSEDKKNELHLTENVEDMAFMDLTSVDMEGNSVTKSVSMLIPEDYDSLLSFLNLTDYHDKKMLQPPALGEAILTSNTAEKMNLSVGDTVTIHDDDMNTATLKISGICDNHFANFLYLNEDFKLGKRDGGINSAWINATDNVDVHVLSTVFAKMDDVMNVTVVQDTKDRVDTMMTGMDFIVFVVILCAAALAFIVLYNLTNINITERIREIATIKVLGFYAGETAQYVFRENMILTAVGALVGLPLGKALHAFIMYNIRLDMVSFNTYIAPISYVYAVALTFGFAVLVNLLMAFKLQKINMAESLKSIE